jgi:hypothetical protein
MENGKWENGKMEKWKNGKMKKWKNSEKFGKIKNGENKKWGKVKNERNFQLFFFK